MKQKRHFLRNAGAVLSLAVLAGCTGMNTTQSGAVGVNRTQYMSSMVPSQALEQEATQQYADILKQAQAKGLLDRDPQQVARVRAIS
ncbi:MAG: M48 family peptidase, partial [Achromobacter mucicolens]